MPAATTDVDKQLETLGLTREDLNEDAVRAAYKKLALQWHPDRHTADPEEAKQKFIEVNEAYKALAEVCRKQNKRNKKSRKNPESTSRTAFWAGSTPTASSSSSGATRGTERAAKAEKAEQSHKAASHAKSDHKPHRSTACADDPAPKAARAHTKHSHHHGHRDSDSDSSSEAGSTHGHAHAHAHGHSKSGRAKEKSKKTTLGEDDYEFIDLGSPLKPLRSPRSFSATTKDWIFPLHLTLEDLYFGAVHRYRITRTLNAVPVTKPSSPVPSSEHGARRQTVQIDVHVSPGWTTGTRIRVPQVGNQRADGSFQDIVFVVAETPHPRFVRRGNDLVLPVRVPWVDPHTPHRPHTPGGLHGDADSDLGHDPRDSGGFYRLGRGAFRQLRHHGLAHPHAHAPPPEEEDEVYVRGINGEEYTIPIPRTLVEAADGTRIHGAGMPVRKHGCVVGMGDMVIRWEFVFPDSDKMQRSRWQSLKDAIHLRLPV
ncbi:hypothetical protein C8Q77DRAFT_1155403 [Trametes polyzona]|nr:hypothetical protein C8Q77DRAFT_1155403 [Trametes polyzona]